MKSRCFYLLIGSALTFLSMPAYSTLAEPDVLARADWHYDASDTDSVVIAPPTQQNDGSVATDGVDKWKNKGSAGNGWDVWAIYPNCLPRYVDGLIDFGDIGSYRDFYYCQEMTDLGTLFWVIDIEQSGDAFLLGHSAAYDFHRGANGEYCWGLYANENVKNGAFYNNGIRVENPAGELIPTGMRVISLVAGGEGASGLKSNRLGTDRGQSGRHGGRRICELVFFRERLNDADRRSVENYLLGKWMKQSWKGGDGALTDPGKWEGRFPFEESQGTYTFPSGSGTVTLDRDAAIRDLDVDGIYTFSGSGSFSLLGKVDVVGTGSATFSLPISGDLVKTGAGRIAFQPQNASCNSYSFEGTVSLENGTLNADPTFTGDTVLENGCLQPVEKIDAGEQPLSLTLARGSTLQLGGTRPPENLSLDPASEGTLVATVDGPESYTLMSASGKPAGVTFVMKDALGDVIDSQTYEICFEDGKLFYSEKSEWVPPYRLTLGGDGTAETSWTDAGWVDANGTSVPESAWTFVNGAIEISAETDGCRLVVDRQINARSIRLTGEHPVTLVWQKDVTVNSDIVNGTGAPAFLDLTGCGYASQELGDAQPVVRKGILTGGTENVTLLETSVPQAPEGWGMCLDAENGLALVFTKKDPAVPLVIGDAMVRYDASARDSIVLGGVGDGTDNAVSGWNDISTNTVNAGPSGDRPVYRDGVVDFGACASGRDLTTVLGAVKTVFWVVDIQQDLRAFLFGCAWCCNFHRGLLGEYCVPPEWDGDYTHVGTFYRDGALVERAWNTRIPTGFQLVSFRCPPEHGGFYADHFCQDRSIFERNGGRRLAEVLAYNKVLSDTEREEVEEYLRIKWADRFGKRVWKGGNGLWNNLL